MSIYSVNYTNLTKQLLPPDKRKYKALAWLRALLTPMQYNRDLLLGDYKDGSSAPVYAVGTFAKGDQVRFNNAIYESLTDTNTDAPTADTWMRVLDNFIGVQERIQYSAHKIVFEWALNKWFGTTFRQPGATSDIYITTNVPVQQVFVVGINDNDSSTVATDSSSEFVSTVAAFSSFNNFTINIPVAVYNALDSISANREAIVRSFADIYNTAGLTYNIITY